MKIRMTIHPIDKQLLERLGIYDSSITRLRDVGGIMIELYDAGYTEILTHVNHYDNPVDDCISVHFKKDMT